MAARQPTSINVHNDKTRRHEKDIRIGHAVVFYNEKTDTWIGPAGTKINNLVAAVQYAEWADKQIKQTKI